MAQTTMTTNPGAGQAGTFATSVGVRTISKVAAEAITPGKGVVITADDQTTCEQPDATGEVTGGRFLGIALLDHKRTTAAYAAGDVVTIAVEGEVWVAVEDAATAGSQPFVRFADPGSTGLGSFRSDADTADAVGLPNAVFTSTQTSAGGLAKVKLGGVFS